MTTDPQQIRTEVDGVLADLPCLNPQAGNDGTSEAADIDAINAVGRQLERAHQILVEALESVEKG